MFVLRKPEKLHDRLELLLNFLHVERDLLDDFRLLHDLFGLVDLLLELLLVLFHFLVSDLYLFVQVELNFLVNLLDAPNLLLFGLRIHLFELCLDLGSEFVELGVREEKYAVEVIHRVILGRFDILDEVGTFVLVALQVESLRIQSLFLLLHILKIVLNLLSG